MPNLVTTERCKHLQDGSFPEHTRVRLLVVDPTAAFQGDITIDLCCFCAGAVHAAAAEWLGTNAADSAQATVKGGSA